MKLDQVESQLGQVDLKLGQAESQLGQVNLKLGQAESQVVQVKQYISLAVFFSFIKLFCVIGKIYYIEQLSVVVEQEY